MAQNFNPPKQKQPKSYQEYLADLESLLKRNTGQGLSIGQDVSSNVPMYLPGKVRSGSGLGDSAPSVAQAGNGMVGMTPATPEPQAQGQVLGDTQQMSASDFLDSWEQIYNDPTPIIQGVGSTQDGGTVSSDGNIYYSDGTIREGGDPNAYAVASVEGGGTRYSDGTTRQQQGYAIASLGQDENGIPLELYSDGTVHYGIAESVQGDSGLSGLISGIFGQDRTITQDYGNINPIEPTPGNVNYGTDIRTRDLTGGQRMLKLPVDAEIVQVYLDDGTQFGTQSGHQGYGNSMLVKLPTGEMLRFSHLSQIANLQPGDVLKAGQVIGTPGTTGNTQGEHLDLEYYDQSGSVSNPSQFTGFTQPENFRTPQSPGTKVSQDIVHELGRVDPTNSPMTPAQNTSVQPTQYNRPIDQINAGVQLAKNDIASGINKANPTGNFDLGITESLQNNPEAARLAQIKTIENTPGLTPETGATELAKQQGTNVFRQFAGNVADIATTPLKKLGLPDLGVSEAIAGGKTVNTDVNLAPQAGASDGTQMSSKIPTAKDYASVLGNNIKDIGTQIGETASSAVSKAGEGISNLAGAGVSALENVFKPKVSTEKRAVGDISGTVDPTQSVQNSSLMDTASSMAKLSKNDVRDPFFKMGGASMFEKYMKPGFSERDALSLDTFTPDFYSDLGNVSSVFGGSKDLGAATNKYIDYERAKYPMMSKMSGGEGYDQGQVDEYNKQVDSYNNSLNQYFGSIAGSVSSTPSIFTPRLAGSSKNIFASPGMAKSPIMSKAPVASFSAPQASASRPTASFSSPSVSRASAPSSSPTSAPTATVNRPAPKQIPVVSNQGLKPVTINKQPVNFDFTTYSSAPSAQKAPQPQSKQSSNIFTKAVSTIKNIFRKK